MHDKYLMVDETAYLLGGRNSYDLFLGEQAALGNIDRDILVYEKEADENSSFYQLKAYFTSVWESSCTKSLSPADSGKLCTAREVLLTDADALRENYPQAYEAFSYEELTMETDGVMLLSNPIEPGNKEPVLWKTLCSWMQSGSDIRIQTPYMICDRSMYADLQEVCSTADVRIMTNAVENGANPFGCSDYLNQKSRILDTGASVDEWLGGRSLHSKMVLIDDSISIVGSFNVDMRSCYLDTELMLVIDCKELNQQLREDFRDMEAKCRMVSTDGETILGDQCADIEMNDKEKVFYSFLKVVMRPFRYLL
jgi:phosphatidylserine/phosphatidylglycerophosphate/cardiolipin synthase-like enzyme